MGIPSPPSTPPGVPESTPGYFDCATNVYGMASHLFHEDTDSKLSEWPYLFYKDLTEHARISQFDILCVLSLAVMWTFLRHSLTRNLFLPIADKYKLTDLNKEKFPESAWKFIFYLCTWSYSLYIVILSGKYDFYLRPSYLWEDYRVGMPVPTDIYIAYAVQFSFYLHSVYGTVFLDRWRKDSLVMIFHHFLTMALIGFSYSTRYHKIGMLVLLLHDVSDVCLEFTKCNVYFKERQGKVYYIHEVISTAGFVGFASSWYFCRLYFFPLKVLYSTGFAVYHTSPGTKLIPFYWFFNIMLWTLLALNIWWFMFIINLLIKVATGQMKEVDDLREEEVLRKISDASHDRKKTMKSGDTAESNGHTAVNGHNGIHDKKDD